MGLGEIWIWIGKYARERGCRVIRASTASFSLAWSAAEFTAVQSVLHPPQKKKTFATFPARPRPPKPASVPACVAVPRARPELLRGWEPRTRFQERCA